MIDSLKAIVREIDIKKDELVKLTLSGKYSFTEELILKKSQELDNLIIQYYRLFAETGS